MIPPGTAWEGEPSLGTEPHPDAPDQGPARPDPAHPGAAHADPAHPDAAHPDPAAAGSAPAPQRGRRRRGRPSLADRAAGGPDTRDLILTSARTEFAERGYDQASIRAIARGAGVDPALVHHYFGTKEQVFAAAVAGTFAPVVEGLEGLSLSGDRLGEQLTRFLFGLWEDPRTRDSLLTILRSAVSNETAARVMRDLVANRLKRRLAHELDGGEDAELRVELAVSQLVGTAMLRYVVRAEPLASTPVEQLVTRLAPVVQHHLTGA